MEGLRILEVGLDCYNGSLSPLGRFPRNKKLQGRTMDVVLTSTGALAALEC